MHRRRKSAFVCMCIGVRRVHRSAQAFRIAIKIYNRKKHQELPKTWVVCCVCWNKKQRKWFIRNFDWIFENLNSTSKIFENLNKFRKSPSPNVLQRVFSPQTHALPCYPKCSSSTTWKFITLDGLIYGNQLLTKRWLKLKLDFVHKKC